MTQSEMDGLEALENDVWGIRQRFVPLQGSATMGSGDEGKGRPELEVGEISDSGEIAKENE